MAIFGTTTIVSSGHAVDLQNFENVFVAPNITVGAETNIAINSDYGHNRADIYGNVVSGGATAIYLGSFGNALAHDFDLVVYHDALVRSYTTDGVIIAGYSSTLVNHGTISGHNAGVGFGADSAMPGTESTLFNDGTIEGDIYGLERRNVGALDEWSINNAGTIRGGQYAFSANGSTAVEKFTNTGHLEGAMKFDGGADFFDTSKGSLKGAIDMGAGDDTVKGSAAGDRITGGLGLDKMAGGKGADYFIFASTAESGNSTATADRIADFVHAQKDHIDLHLIDAVAGGADDAFHWIGKTAFHGTAGELHYKVTGGNAFISGDVDGDGVADFMIRLDHVTSLAKGDFVL